jgi:predicted AlkP superfamily pyrophosphatase or phosphodiesterase
MNTQQKLKLIMEGAILNEGDVIQFGDHHLRERRYQEELDRLQTEFNRFIDDLAQTIAYLSRKKEDGSLSNDEYLAKMGELESRRALMITYNSKINHLKHEIQTMQQSRGH